MSARQELYWGDRFSELPRCCVLGFPEVVRVPYGHRPMGGYEALVTGLLGRGLACPGGPGACAAPGCGHAQVWHRKRTRTKPCEIEGCECTAFTRDGGRP